METYCVVQVSSNRWQVGVLVQRPAIKLGGAANYYALDGERYAKREDAVAAVDSLKSGKPVPEKPEAPKPATPAKK